MYVGFEGPSSSLAQHRTLWVQVRAWRTVIRVSLKADIRMRAFHPHVEWVVQVQIFRDVFTGSHIDPVMTILPVVIMYVFAQKYIIKGMTAGTAKG